MILKKNKNSSGCTIIRFFSGWKKKTGFESSSMSSRKFAVLFRSGFFSSLLSSYDMGGGGGVGVWGGGSNYASFIQQFSIKCQYL